MAKMGYLCLPKMLQLTAVSQCHLDDYCSGESELDVLLTERCTVLTKILFEPRGFTGERVINGHSTRLEVGNNKPER